MPAARFNREQGDMNRRYLLLQVRDDDDPMRGHEVLCFARALDCPAESIRCSNLLSGRPGRRDFESVDVVLMGGSGDYSVLDREGWIEQAMDAMRELHEMSKPTFASCWGFQAMAKALGGVVEHDLERSEIGSIKIDVTAEGRADQVFCGLKSRFRAQAGHQDSVTELPADALLLASSRLVEIQAFRFAGKPIYCTQFHPELSRNDIELRLRTYPKYVEQAGGGPPDQCMPDLVETPVAESIIRRFIEHLD